MTPQAGLSIDSGLKSMTALPALTLMIDGLTCLHILNAAVARETGFRSTVILNLCTAMALVTNIFNFLNEHLIF